MMAARVGNIRWTEAKMSHAVRGMSKPLLQLGDCMQQAWLTGRHGARTNGPPPLAQRNRQKSYGA
jgi:hypothetical protein